MQYLGKLVGGQATRNNFIRSMDLEQNRDPDSALAAYCDHWFSSRKKQYVNEALKHVLTRSLFWTTKALCDMLEEILVSFEGEPDEIRALARDVDALKSKICLWGQKNANRAVTDKDLVDAVKAFEIKHRYVCPETYRTCWMNTGAYITLAYGIKYEGLVFPGRKDAQESLSLLKVLALEVIADMDHNVDDRLFRLCHAAYLDRLLKAESANP